MNEDCFQSLDLTSFRKSLSRLHEQVGQLKGRIEVKRRGCEDDCVLISKVELESLESALEILSESDEFQAMCRNISQIAAATMPSTVGQIGA